MRKNIKKILSLLNLNDIILSYILIKKVFFCPFCGLDLCSRKFLVSRLYLTINYATILPFDDIKE